MSQRCEKKRIKSRPQNILAIDDAKDILALLEFELSEAGYNIFIANSGQQGLEILDNETIDLVLLDIIMPEMSGPQVLRKIKADKTLKHIPVIVLAASERTDDIVSALDLGADDFVSKPYIARILLARIRTSLRLLEKTRALEQIALTDFLTGINNRRQFYELTENAISKSKREGSCLSVAILDIDYFKQVNDTYGHDVGDLVLIHFASLMEKFFRQYDIVGRIGGEEFAVCIFGANKDDAIKACERFRLELANAPLAVELNGKVINLTVFVSIGVSVVSNEPLELIIKQADKALYHAKETGRNKVCQFECL